MPTNDRTNETGTDGKAGPRPAQSVVVPAGPGPAMLTVRPVRHDDLVEGLEVYRLRNHAGDLTLDRATITSVTRTPVYLPEHRRRTDRHDPVGVKVTGDGQSVYGTTTTVHLYDCPEALDADFPLSDPDDPQRRAAARRTTVHAPSDPNPAYARDRQRALERQADPGIYVTDPEGPVTLPPTPNWGAQAYLSLVVPGIDPDDLVAALTDMLTQRFPGHRVMKMQARPAAERRVNVYRLDYDAAVRDGLSEPPRQPLAFNVLDCEGFSIGGQGSLIEQVNPNAPRPIIGE